MVEPTPNSVPIDGHCDPRFARVREVFEKKVAANEVGASIAFTLNGESVVDLWGGYADKDKNEPWGRNTIANTYSTTKGMTALIAHRLVEQGKIDLDAPVVSVWPEFAAEGKQDIPIRWLLSHQSGLPAIRETLPAEALYDWDAMCAGLAASKPWWTPGEKHGYHPVTYGFLVGEIIRRVSGKTVGQLFREDVAEPLQADFHIGLPTSEHGRVANMIGSLAPPKTDSKTESGKPALRIKGPLSDFMRDMTDPTTMVGAAFNNPHIKAGAHNTPEWRCAEIPAANGHGNARALARIYGALACGGTVDGIRLLDKASIDRARTEQVSGPDAVLGQMPMRYGLGYMLRSDFMQLSPSENAFGHPGAGGSIGMADPDAGVGFGFVMNKMSQGLVGGPTGFAVLKAFFEAL